MPEMQSLIERVQQLSGSSVWWSRASQVLIGATAVVTLLYFFASARALKYGGNLRDAQEALDRAKDDQLTLDLKDKESQIAFVKQDTAKATEETARLTKEAETAKTERAEADKQINIAKADAARAREGAEVARADAVRAKEGIANAEARSIEASAEVARLQLTVAKAETERAQAQKALIELQERLADRVISDADALRITEQIKQYGGREFQVVTYWDDREPLATAQRLADILVAAKWKLDQPKNGQFLLGGLSGIQVFFHPEASTEARQAAEMLVSVLNSVGLSAVIKQQNDPGHPSEKIYINVGTKPR